MTVEQALGWLEQIRTQHGGDVPVYFDCPKCGCAYTPGAMVTRVLMTGVDATPTLPASRKVQKARKV